MYYNLKKEFTKSIYEKINRKFYSQYSPNIEIDNLEINQHLMYTISELERLQKIIDFRKKDIEFWR